MSKNKSTITINYGKSKDTLSSEAKEDLSNFFNGLASSLSKPVSIQIDVVNQIDSFATGPNQRTGGITSYLGNNKFKIEFDRFYIDTFDNTEEHYLYPTALHEFAHVEDKITFLNSKSIFLKKVENKARTFKEICRNIAFDVWTEFFAYRFTFINCKEYQYPTFLYLVKLYEKLLKEKDKFLSLIKDREPTDQEIGKYIGSVDCFLYSTTMYLAGTIYGKPKHHKYVSKTQNTKSFKYVDSTSTNLLKKIYAYIRSRTIKTKEKSFVSLGEFILNNIYDKLNIYISKDKSIYCLGVYDDKK